MGSEMCIRDRLLLRLVAAGWWLSPAGAARLPLLRLPVPWVSVSGCAGECPRRCPTGVLRLPGYRLPCSATAHRMEREARSIQSADYYNSHNPHKILCQKGLITLSIICYTRDVSTATALHLGISRKGLPYTT